MNRTVRLILSVLLTLSVGTASATTFTFSSIALRGNQEAPTPVVSAADLTFNGTYDDVTNVLSFTITTATALSSNITVAHIHGPANAKQAGPVYLDFATALTPATFPFGSNTVNYTGTATLSEAQELLLLSGRSYVNIHTTVNPGGEVRGQLVTSNVFQSEQPQLVGSFNGFGPDNNGQADNYRTTLYRKYGTIFGNAPTDGRGNWTTTMNVRATGGDVTPDAAATFLIISGPNANHFQNKWANATVAVDAAPTSLTYLTGGGSDNNINLGTEGFYTFSFQDAGYADAKVFVARTSNAPLFPIRTAGIHLADGSRFLRVTMRATPTSAAATAKSPEERVYMRFADNNEYTSSSQIFQMTAETAGDTTFGVVIPAVASGNTVNYYAFTSTLDLATLNGLSEGDKSLAAIRHDQGSPNTPYPLFFNASPTVQTGFNGNVIYVLGATGSVVNFANTLTITGGGLTASRADVVPTNNGFTGTGNSPDGTAFSTANLNVIAPRVWTITSTLVGTFSYTPSFDITDLPGLSNSAKVVILKRDNAANPWTVLTTSRTLSGGRITVQAPVQTTFSEFAIGGNTADNPLPVELSNFGAAQNGSSVRVSWSTASEKNNLGFELYRNGIKIASHETDNSLDGKGTTANLSTYSYTDATVEVGNEYTYTLRSIDFDGKVNEYRASATVRVETQISTLPTAYRLEQNYPNPFNPTTRITVQLKTAVAATLKIYDVLGREVADLSNQLAQTTAEQRVVWNASSATSGVYYYRLTSPEFSRTMKMTLLK